MTYQVERQLDALGDATRRAIFERIARGPVAVGDIAGELPVSRPAVSQHLKVLKDAGLVTDRAEGTRRLYSIDREGLASLRAYFETFWDEALDAFRRAAEATAPAEKKPVKPARSARRLARTRTTKARVRRKERGS